MQYLLANRTKQARATPLSTSISTGAVQNAYRTFNSNIEKKK